ncbi:hypothetical protein RRG08_013740 [Elysia crispata]|uniref:DDE Tnp4 domain-containing protein n=1 Tax=Elysia crispata TaxID=231223 RepID=A0AAE0ZPC6_9GAST|nr:hypothetical protein RRG08_013740 [Elysia crispata]
MDKFLQTKPKHGVMTTATDCHREFVKDTCMSGDKRLLYWCNIVLDHHRKFSVSSHFTTDKHKKRKLEKFNRSRVSCSEERTGRSAVHFVNRCSSLSVLVLQNGHFVSFGSTTPTEKTGSCFILVDCGQCGRVSDAGVYQSSHMSTVLEEGNLNIPKQAFKINGSDIEVPYMVIGDEAFPLKTYLMKPFSARTLNEKRRIYNYKHSRARLSVECTFGILARKFEIFQRPMRVEPDKAIIITNAAIGLHNFIRRRDGNMTDRTSSICL